MEYDTARTTHRESESRTENVALEKPAQRRPRRVTLSVYVPERAGLTYSVGVKTLVSLARGRAGLLRCCSDSALDLSSGYTDMLTLQACAELYTYTLQKHKCTHLYAPCL